MKFCNCHPLDSLASFHPNDFKGRYLTGKTLRRIIRNDDCSVEYIHKPCDPQGINRIYLKVGDLNVELLPSKGLSVGAVMYDSSPLLWLPLLAGLPDPDVVDLTKELIWNGETVQGFGFIEYLVGGVMMFGLENWGMPYTDKETGNSGTLHGEVSNIPIEKVSVNSKSASAKAA